MGTDSKADRKINRTATAISCHWIQNLGPLLLQYHQGTINTPWKYFALQYIYENKLESVSDLKKHMTEINKSFPWLDALSITACYKSFYNSKNPFYEEAKTIMEKFKDRPAHTEKELKRCEE